MGGLGSRFYGSPAVWQDRRTSGAPHATPWNGQAGPAQEYGRHVRQGDNVLDSLALHMTRRGMVRQGEDKSSGGSHGRQCEIVLDSVAQDKARREVISQGVSKSAGGT